MARDTTPQNSGHATPDRTHTFWRNSILVGPQTAGLPTVHNEDEDAGGSDRQLEHPTRIDLTGGALGYHQSQRRK
jgi:hypothetical protein